MKTGEGKTLVATLPVYLNALERKGVHVVTVNDYLAKRDAEWMGKIYKGLGLSVGIIVHDLDDEERKDSYNCDITYGTNNEYGFDYLRDNMKFRIDDCVQRGHNYAIVDEVDSILIDEARTPLIISGPSEESTDKYYKINRIIPRLEKGEVHDGKEPGEKWTTGDYTVDEKHRSVALTEQGETEAAEFGKTYKLDVIVIPTHMPMVRKDAIDMVYRTEEEKFRNAAKEIKERHDAGQPVLVGTISVEKSEKLAGILKKMGVKLEGRKAKNHKREATIVAQAGRKGAVTVSTNMAGRGTDILLGGNPEGQAREFLRRQNIDPDQMAKEEWQAVLAKFKQETDRDHEDVVALGGLHIVATERHESRRIDNQLRGRSGRQGDPGSSRFYLSLQDDLLRIFGGERMQNLMLRLGMEEDMPIESKMISKRIQKAQEPVEAQNFEARKHLLEYDDVMNKQRQAVYGMRRQLLEGIEQKDRVMEMTRGVVGSFIDMRCAENIHADNYDL